MRTIPFAALLLVPGLAWSQAPNSPSLDYNIAELRFVDGDQSGGDGLRLAGSYRFDSNWMILGRITDLDFGAGVDAMTIEAGGGYVWPYRTDWDLLANVRLVRTDVNTPLGGADDTGIGIAGGVRGMVAPQFEIRGAVNYVSVGDGDTYLEIAGDYYFTQNLAAGLSMEVDGDLDIWTVGVRWFFR